MRRRWCRGFTLIELLVVIAIIMLLAAITLPVLSRVQRLARRTQCLSNMRQMYTTFATYSNQFDQYLPKSIMEYYRIRGQFDSVPALEPFLDDPRILYCPVREMGPLPDIDTRIGTGGTYVGWSFRDEPFAHHVLGNIAMYFNPSARVQFGAYDDNVWPVGRRWRNSRAPLISHRRVMRFNLQHWDDTDWRCQNWYPHGRYHDVLTGDGANHTHSEADWQARPRLWFDWGSGDRHNLFY